MKWYQRPSPIWFFPGTFIIALTMGMTIAPKLEIYTQLICRAMPAEKSGVTLPPPVIEIADLSAPASSYVLRRAEPTAMGRILFEWSAAPEPEVQPSTSAAKSSTSAPILAPAPGAPARTGDTWSKQCHKSSAVQSSVAQLALLLSLLMGVLSSLTTGFWGAYSDRRAWLINVPYSPSFPVTPPPPFSVLPLLALARLAGRKPVLLLALCGTLAMDSVFLLTVHYHHILSYNFLLLGPFLDGLVGGWSTAQATTSAYLSDVTSAGSRARVFSAVGGLMFGGFAFGPILGSLLITHTEGNVLTPFYAALAVHVVYLAVMAGVLPESLGEERRMAARERWIEEMRVQAEAEREEDERDRQTMSLARRSGKKVRRVLAKQLRFFRPLSLLLPKPRSDSPVAEEDRTNIEWGAGMEVYEHPEEVWRTGEGKRGRDWGLTKIAMAYASYMTIIAVMSVKLLYANYTFGWSATEDGFFLSFIGFLRVVTLIGILPLVIKLVRRRPAPIPPRPRPSTPHSGAEQWDKEKRWLRVVHDSHFDLGLAKASLVLDLAGFLLFLSSPYLLATLSTWMRGSPQHVALFLSATFIQSLGSGASPAIQSLALAHASPRDAGRLFASLSVVQSLSSQVFGPIVFGSVFISTVGKWSEAIFALASALAAVAIGCLMRVRLRRVFVPASCGEPGVVDGEEGPKPDDGQERRRSEAVRAELGRRRSSAGPKADSSAA
ncbi:MFS transporter [Rhodotorula toruloides]|uniref:MFS transporter n=1 Tax=Rhodotorula toruloides TaxID=5286 RepID=A0A511KL07_RHOTO|nr:MFS transporter [Rhodotorula toruloides]